MFSSLKWQLNDPQVQNAFPDFVVALKKQMPFACLHGFFFNLEKNAFKKATILFSLPLTDIALLPDSNSGHSPFLSHSRLIWGP